MLVQRWYAFAMCLFALLLRPPTSPKALKNGKKAMLSKRRYNRSWHLVKITSVTINHFVVFKNGHWGIGHVI